jgi:hypothetical protein
MAFLFFNANITYQSDPEVTICTCIREVRGSNLRRRTVSRIIPVEIPNNTSTVMTASFISFPVSFIYEALCYKPQGRWLHSGWGHLNYQLT